MKEIALAYIGGGSRDWAWTLMRDLALEEQMEGVVRLYDIDQEAAEQNAVIGNLISADPRAKSHWKYQAAPTLQQALTGADFVVISILPATFNEMESDVHAPEKYGIYQSVGDTVGPGGSIRALRTVPMFVTIAQAIRDYAPQAWVINYTNPMSLCVKTLYEAFPQIKAFGCCHAVFHTQDLLVDMLEENGYKDVKRNDVKCVVTGVNHFTWIAAATYKEMDLFPDFDKFARKYAQTGYDKEGKAEWKENTFKCAYRVLFDLYLRYGAIPAADDRHICEFLPPWYLKDPQTVKEWMFGLTTVAWRKEDLVRRLKRSEALRTGAEKIEITPSGEEGYLMMKALLGLGDMIANVNLPNYGQIPNLPLGTVVETNALFCANGVSPISAGNLSRGLLGLIMPHALNQFTLLEAALRDDRTLAFQAFLNEPLMQLGLQDAETLFAQMIRNTAAYLPKGLLR